MKTKEEILKSRFNEYWSQEVDKKTHPFIIDILDCMEEYANQQLQLGGVIKNEEIQMYIEENLREITGDARIDEQAFYEGAKWMRDQLLQLGGVSSNQRKLLIAFTDWHSSKYYEEIATEDEVDEFLKSTFTPKGDNFTNDDNYWK